MLTASRCSRRSCWALVRSATGAAQPFQPFAIHLSNGEVHEVRHPERIMFGGGKVVIYDAEGDCFKFCALIHVNNVQFLQAA